MKWIRSDQQLPPIDEDVLGTFLNRYSNADWEWSQPYITRLARRHDGSTFWNSDYIAPEHWCAIELPPVPESAARDYAKSVAERDQRRKAIIAKSARDFDAANP